MSWDKNDSNEFHESDTSFPPVEVPIIPSRTPTNQRDRNILDDPMPSFSDGHFRPPRHVLQDMHAIGYIPECEWAEVRKRLFRGIYPSDA